MSISLSLYTLISAISRLKYFVNLFQRQQRYIHVVITCFVSHCYFKNFLALCASGYYDNNIFHRNIPGFMIQVRPMTCLFLLLIQSKQTGDPTGTGKGGNSIWGKKFNDEIRSTLKVTKMGCYYHHIHIIQA